MEELLESVKEWASKDPAAVPKEILALIPSASPPVHGSEDSSSELTDVEVDRGNGDDESGVDAMDQGCENEDEEDGINAVDQGRGNENKESGVDAMNQDLTASVPESAGAGEGTSKPTVSTPSYSAESYLCKGKSNPAHFQFRHVLRKAATEAKAWGKLTYRELNVAQKKYIYDRVIGECPELKGHEREIDKILVNSLIQSKHYQRKIASSKVPADKGTSHGDRNKSSVASSSSSTSHTKSKVQAKTAKKSKPAGKNKGSDSTSSATETKMPYEQMRERNIKTRQRVLEALKETELTPDSDVPFKPGDTLSVLDSDEVVADCIFLKKRDAMYCDVIFVKHRKRPQSKEISLPQCVKGCPNKLMLHDLEKHDEFVWKIEKLRGGAESSKWSLRSKSGAKDN